MKALAKERHDRYPSVTAFIIALQPPSVQHIPPSPPPYPLKQVGGTPVHTPPIRDVRQTPLERKEEVETPPVRSKGRNNAQTTDIAANQVVVTKPTGGDRTLAVLCYLSFPLLIAYGAGLIFILICYFAGKKRPFVHFHFMQSLIFFVLSAIILVVGATSSSEASSAGYAIVGTYAVLTLLYMILAGAGKRAHIPIIGFFASRYAKRQPKGARTKS